MLFLPSRDLSRIDLLKTRTVVVNWRMLKAHLESCFTFLPCGESKFVLSYNGISKMFCSFTPDMPVDGSIQKTGINKLCQYLYLQRVHRVCLWCNTESGTAWLKVMGYT